MKRIIILFLICILPTSVHAALYAIHGTYVSDGTYSIEPLYKFYVGGEEEFFGSGTIHIEYFDGNQNLGTIYPYHETFLENGMEYTMFYTHAELSDDVDRLEYFYQGTLFAQTSRSVNPPVVSNVEVEIVDDFFELTWDAYDQDGDELSYAIYVASNAGAFKLVANYHEFKWFYHPVIAEQGNVIFRVVATDGINEGYADSDLILVPTVAPVTYIEHPQDGLIVNEHYQISLIGTAYSQTQGLLNENFQTWSSDRDGILSSPSLLSLGTHIITLSATEGSLTGSSSVQVEITDETDPDAYIVGGELRRSGLNISGFVSVSTFVSETLSTLVIRDDVAVLDRIEVSLNPLTVSQLPIFIQAPGRYLEFELISAVDTNDANNFQRIFIEYCGNGILEEYETCDDGNQIDDDYCTNRCVPPEDYWCSATDISQDGDVDFEDLTLFSKQNGRTDCGPENDGCGGADLNFDTRVDDIDREHFSPYFGRMDCYGSSIIGEAGEITVSQDNIHVWRRVNLQNEYRNPVVFANIVTYNGAEPVHVRLKDVTSNSFRFQLEEWDYLNGGHVAETVHYMVFEEGLYQKDGANFQVMSIEADHEFVHIPDAQAVLSQIQTFNGAQSVVTRQHVIEGENYVKVQEEENNDGVHAIETLGIFLTNHVDAPVFEIASMQTDHKWKGVNLFNRYSQPILISNMASYTGSNTAGIRIKNLDSDSVSFMVEEEKSMDEEIWHYAEDINYMIFESGNIEAMRLPNPLT